MPTNKRKKSSKLQTTNNGVTKSKESSASMDDRLSDRQIKTLAALRSLGTKSRTKRIQLLKAYAKQIRATVSAPSKPSGKPSSQPGNLPIRHQFKIHAGVSLNVSAEAREYLKQLKANASAKSGLQLTITGRDNGIVFLPQKKGKSKPIGKFRYVGETDPSVKKPLAIIFGVSTSEKNRKQLDVVIRYPVTAPVLRNPSQNAIGDLTLQKKIIASAIPEPEKSNEDTSASNENEIDALVNQILNPGQSGDVLELDAPRLDNVAWQDFYAYEYLEDPETITQPKPSDPFSPVSETVLELDDPELLLFQSKLREAIAAKYATVESQWVTIRETSTPPNSGDTSGTSGGPHGGGGGSGGGAYDTVINVN